MRIFCGYDERESLGFHVFVESLMARSGCWVSLTPLVGLGKMLGGVSSGTNAFSDVRFLVPWLCGYEGVALYVDGSDMLVREDVGGIFDVFDERYGVQVVKREYRTRAVRKYVGTEMESVNEDYPRKNWSSVVLWNCGHEANRVLTPEWVSERRGLYNGGYLHRFSWLGDELVGGLDERWNVLIGEDGERGEGGDKEFGNSCGIAHYTLGLPGCNGEMGDERVLYEDEWRAYAERVNRVPARVK